MAYTKRIKLNEHVVRIDLLESFKVKLDKFMNRDDKC